jgi:hypothetical protein
MRQKNKKIPPIYLTMVLTAISDPSFVMTELDPKLPTKVVEIGHKGKYVGLLGVYRDKQQRLQMQYQTVLMDPALDPAEKDKPAHPIVNLFETYTQDLKRQDVMSKYPRTVHLNQLVGQNQKGLKARYIGSERCGDCHDHAYKVWKDWKDPKGKVNGHAFATETLEHVKFPSNRNFDPECMRCHTTGMQHATGYNDYVPNLALWPMKQEVARKKLDQHNQSLRGVGCESCHGPGSEHEKAPNNKAIYEFINPYGLTAEERLLEPLGKNRTPEQEKRYQALFQPRMGALNAFCFKCHDEENDVHWGKAGHKIEDMWIGKKLIHRTPPPAKNNGPVIIQPRQPRGDAIDDRKK